METGSDGVPPARTESPPPPFRGRGAAPPAGSASCCCTLLQRCCCTLLLLVHAAAARCCTLLLGGSLQNSGRSETLCLSASLPLCSPSSTSPPLSLSALSQSQRERQKFLGPKGAPDLAGGTALSRVPLKTCNKPLYN